MARFKELLDGYQGAVDELTGKEISDLNTLHLGANEGLLLKLQPELKIENN